VRRRATPTPYELGVTEFDAPARIRQQVRPPSPGGGSGESVAETDPGAGAGGGCREPGAGRWLTGGVQRLGLLVLIVVGLAGCHASRGSGSLTDYCTAITNLRDSSLIPDDITDHQAVTEARKTLDNLAKLAPSDIADEIGVLRKAMSAIGDIDFTKPDATDQVEKVLNDQNVDDAAGKVGQFTQTACGAAVPPSDDAG
jgi:hypothetical protein